MFIVAYTQVFQSAPEALIEQIIDNSYKTRALQVVSQHTQRALMIYIIKMNVSVFFLSAWYLFCECLSK